MTGATPVKYSRIMPRKNSLKIYVEGGYYHLYNRGVEKRIIFLEDKDYKVFLHFLKKYLSPPEPNGILLTATELTGFTPVRPRVVQSLYGSVSLLAYCLMPNHFHFLVKQTVRDGITKLVNRIATNYGMYFNKKYERVGPLFQGVYKAVLIDNNEQLLHLSRYIHLNPLEGGVGGLERLVDYNYSSYGDYLGLRRSDWVKVEEVISFFRSDKRLIGKDDLSYQSFVEDFVGEYDLTGVVLEG